VASMPGGGSPDWQQRHIDALGAWCADDKERLVELCEREIARTVASVARRYCIRGGETELQSFAAAGVAKAAQRWDPNRGVPFQAYARFDIYWETERGARALVMHARDAAQDAQATRRVLVEALERHTLAWWRARIAELDEESLATFRGVLEQERTELVGRIGDRKYTLLEIAARERQIRINFQRPTARLIDLTPVIELGTMLEIREERFPFAPLLSAKAMSRWLAMRGYIVSDKTVGRWLKDAERAPENTELLDLALQIIEPRAHRRHNR
jgi:hypothetical protein